MEKLTRWVNELRVSGIDTDLIGFSKEELDKQFGDATKAAPGCDEDHVPVLKNKRPKTQLGDLYQLGAHRLLCGDSTSPAAVKKLMGGEKA